MTHEHKRCLWLSCNIVNWPTAVHEPGSEMIRPFSCAFTVYVKYQPLLWHLLPTLPKLQKNHPDPKKRLDRLADTCEETGVRDTKMLIWFWLIHHVPSAQTKSMCFSFHVAFFSLQVQMQYSGKYCFFYTVPTRKKHPPVGTLPTLNWCSSSCIFIFASCNCSLVRYRSKRDFFSIHYSKYILYSCITGSYRNIQKRHWIPQCQVRLDSL